MTPIPKGRDWTFSAKRRASRVKCKEWAAIVAHCQRLTDMQLAKEGIAAGNMHTSKVVALRQRLFRH